MIKSTNFVLMVDVDDTLVRSKDCTPDHWYDIRDPLTGNCYEIEIFESNLTYVKRAKAKGMTVIVWSKQGVEWSEAVVKYLNLEDSVDMILSKPIEYMDDKLEGNLLGNRIYFPLGHSWGQ